MRWGGFQETARIAYLEGTIVVTAVNVTATGNTTIICTDSLTVKMNSTPLDKDLVKEYKEGIIALSGGVVGEIPHLILNVGETQAEEALKWWLDIFGDDFYIELNRHDLDEENHLNEVLVSLASKYSVKLVAANELFYLDQEDAKAHDVLICIKENEKQSTPIGRGRGFRPGLKNTNCTYRCWGRINLRTPPRPSPPSKRW